MRYPGASSPSLRRYCGVIAIVAMFAVWSLIVVAGAMAAQAPASSALSPDDFVTVSDAASPRVAYSVGKTGNGVTLTVDVASFEVSPAPAPTPAPAPASSSAVVAPLLPQLNVGLGLAEGRKLVLTNKEAKIQKLKDITRYTFTVPAATDLSRLRLAIAVEWPGANPAIAAVRQREVFLQKPGRATHSGLSANTADWLALDVAEFQRAATDRKQRISFDFAQPVEGKASIVIEDAQGKRVRNLISGQTLGAGTHRMAWDGCDDDGLIVAPGKYNWRSISHAGLSKSYLFSFCNGPGSNHGTFQAAATNGTLMFFGSPVSEGGYQVVTLKPDGEFVRGSNAPLGTGLQCIRLAADDKYIYAAYDGTYWGQQQLDKKKPDWKSDRRIVLVRFDINTGAPVDFPKTPTRFSILRTYEVGPGSADARPEGTVLAGLAYLNGKLYMADNVAGEITEIAPETGKALRTFPALSTGSFTALAAGKDELYAIVKGKDAHNNTERSYLHRIETQSGTPAPDATSTPLSGQPAGLAVDKDGSFYISDSKENVVYIYAAGTRNLTTTLGRAGPLKPGPYDALQFQNPAGLAVGPNGWLWVTEPDRWQPKRLAAFDPKTLTVMAQYFGPTSYGAPGASFDPTDKNKWIGLGTAFTLDFDKKTATPTAVLGGETGTHYRWWRQDGRTFLITYGKVTYIQEVMPDGMLRKLAFLSSAHQYAYAHEWRPEPEFVEAFQRDYPAQKYETGSHGKPGHGFGMLWADRNGDGKMDTDEIEFSTVAENFAGSGWGHDFYDLTLRVTATVKGKSLLVALKPDGWWPGGAPKYPPLNPTVEAGIPITGLQAGGGTPESTVDRFGTLVINSDPRMRAYAPDGKEKWSFPNNWTNVHGSQRAPLPNTGEFQGILFFTGVAPLDDKSDVMAMNGNHGRLFFMSSDGMYIDELFPDVRLTSTQDFTDRNILGGECFGGSFSRDEKTGNYYFQGGGIEYRIYQVKGLDKMMRAAGSLNVTPEQIVAAERNVIRKAAEQVATKAGIPWIATAPAIDGKDADWKDVPETARWEQSGGRFPVSVKAAYDAQKLYLLYTVRDDSPWVNNGADWQSLFKTGDGIDIQLGTDPAANPTRSGPVPGDIRLFIAPSKEGNTAVLYRHRLKPGTGTATNDNVVFQSPWRAEKVDSVRKLTGAEIAVTKENNNLYRVEVAVPLADIGLDATAVAGKPLRGDFGVIYGDAGGTVNILRSYWSNKATGLVNDVPGEIMLTPNAWGDITVEAKK